jgi:glycosyltransferase involved in cell wall biosynthesis
MSVIVAQLGARMHYAVPRILHKAGRLERFYTDICAVKGWPKYLGAIPAALRTESIERLRARVPTGVPEHLITSFSSFGVEYAWRLKHSRSSGEQIETYLWAAKKFARLILERDPIRTGVYTFNSAGVELLTAAREHGRRAILEQTIAPREIEERLLLQEQELHPGWEEPIQLDPRFSEYTNRERSEWNLADTIVCGSEFVRSSIQQCGGPAGRCAVVPYGVEIPVHKRRTKRREGPLRVLMVGTIGLRKGVPYLLEAARQLKGEVTFRLVGPIQLRKKAADELAEHVELRGQIPRSQIEPHFEWADVFLLPSICEGSAVSTYEALAYGLPIIATPNSGTIIRDGVEGFIVPIRDPRAIANKLGVLHQDRNLLKQMSEDALDRARFGGLDAYGERFLPIVGAELYPVNAS